MNFSEVKGINLASGFKLQAESPLDVRSVVDTIAERDALVTIHAAYEGIRVYVKATKLIYVYNGTSWVNTNTTYGLASASANGLLSAADFKKLAKFTETEAGYLTGVTSSIQTQLNGKAAASHGTHVTYSTTAPKANGTASAGTATTVARSDHGHPLQTSVSGAAGSATNDSSGQKITSTYIKKLAVSGRTITFTRGDGTTGSITTQDTVYGLATASANGLLSSGDFTKLSEFTTEEAGYLSGVTSSIQSQLNGKAAASHGTHVTYATVAPKANGTAAVGTSAKVAREDHVHPLQTSVSGAAGSATNDSAGQNISTTYIKALSVNGKVITYTKGDGTTGTITTQDTNTTYSTFKAATASAAGGTGLVPAPAAGANTKYLRGDGTWQTPPNTTYGVVSSAANGLMTPAMLEKLNGIAEDATKVTIDSALSSTSTNPVQNKVINTALAGKANSSHGTHVTYSTTAPKANGTAAVGTASTVARSDHVHPLQTSVSGSAGSATNDSAGQNISTTYIKALSVSGRTITYTKGDGSTGTITTQDTNTTYSAFKAATASAAGGAGLVPAPAAGANTKYLRGDGTWQTPPNTTYSTGNATTAGITKLYTGTGTATDGTMTQAAINTALAAKANSSHGTHVTYATVAPKANGTAAVGTSAKVAREDHVHPLQTSVSGSAGSATNDSGGQNIRTTYIKALSVSGRTITYTKGDGSTGTITTQDTNTTYSTGTASVSGLTKLYTGTGTATDGTMTQSAITTQLNSKAATSHTHSNYSGKSTKTTPTLSAASWSGSGPYTITVSVPAATTTNNIEVLIPGTATDTQVEAWMNACIVNGTQAAGSITLKAYGEKPEINIPIEVIVRADV